MALGCYPGVRELVAGTHLWQSPRISICAERADSAVLNQLGFRGTIQHMNMPQWPKYDGLGSSLYDKCWRLRYGKAFPHRTGCVRGIGAA
jgi:hypothetical protein